jgi:septum formation protein
MNSERVFKIILASASPRRSELLRQIGVNHDVYAVDVDESPLSGESAQQLVARLARIKALAGRERLGAPYPVLGADTVVVLGEVVFGKPLNENDGISMLLRLGGRKHRVLTAVALALPGGDSPVLEALSDTVVSMRSIDPAEARAYWATGEPADKAGGYAIQGLGAVFIESLEGSYSGVMGLPLYETARLLQAAGR